MNYEEIIENLKPDAVISMMLKLGADRYEDREKYIIFPTICHNTDASEASMKLYFYKDTKLFVCYTECANMSIFKFLRFYYEARQIEYDWYQDIYEVVCGCSEIKAIEGFTPETYRSLKERYQIKRKEKELPEFSTKALECFVKRYPDEWLADGISTATMDEFGILYSISQNKIIIPHYDANDRLVGIRGRALNEWEVENVGKYAPIRLEQTWYKHPLSMNLYGLNITKNNIRQRGICYIVEGEKAVMQMNDFSFPNCAVAVCGSSFNKYQLNILMKQCAPSEIVICFDKEEKPGESKYFYKLLELCRKYMAYSKFSFIYDTQNLLGMKESPTDQGEEVFLKLLNRRVQVK